MLRNILVVLRTDEETVLFREKEFSSRSLSPEMPLRVGRIEEGLGREERFSGLLVTPSWQEQKAAFRLNTGCSKIKQSKTVRSFDLHLSPPPSTSFKTTPRQRRPDQARIV